MRSPSFRRPVYPIYGLRVDTPAVAEFVLAVHYGGLHAVGELFALATLLLSVAMRRGVFGLAQANDARGWLFIFAGLLPDVQSHLAQKHAPDPLTPSNA